MSFLFEIKSLKGRENSSYRQGIFLAELYTMGVTLCFEGSRVKWQRLFYETTSPTDGRNQFVLNVIFKEPVDKMVGIPRYAIGLTIMV